MLPTHCLDSCVSASRSIAFATVAERGRRTVSPGPLAVVAKPKHYLEKNNNNSDRDHNNGPQSQPSEAGKEAAVQTNTKEPLDSSF